MKKKILLTTFAALLVAIGLQIRFDLSPQEVEKQYALPESKFAEIAGQRVHFTDEGKGEVVLLIHGTAASLHTWQDWMPALKKQFRVLRVDLPAFGFTGPAKDRDYSIDAYVRFIENFLTHLKVKQLNLVGNSLGGQIAWHYAAQHPDDIHKLVLIDSAGFTLPKIPLPIRVARLPGIGKIARYIGPRFLVKKSLKQVYFDDNKVTDTLIDRYYAMSLRQGNRDAFVDRAVQRKDDDPNLLRRVRMPTLILWGRHDEWIPVEHAESFRKKLLLPQVIIYENAGHVPHEEIPQQTAADVLQFLK